MYSGITQGLFEVTEVERKEGYLRYTVQFDQAFCRNIKIGASVNIDGVCQTIVAINDVHLTFEAMAQTLAVTTLNSLDVGTRVSAERSLRVGDENGGHEVAGHVRGVAALLRREATDNNLRLTFALESDWIKYINDKGFIALDGSSLTVAEVDRDAATISVCLIPETCRLTNLGDKQVGDKVNVELDHRTVTIVETVERVLKDRP